MIDVDALTLARLIRSKEVSPVAVVDAVLARIEALQPTVNAFITVTADEARDTARRAEAAVMRGDRLGPLHGVPFSVKDLVFTKGVRTTMGSLIFADQVPTEDAVPVRRLREAGAVLVGKTTTPEFGHKPFTDSPLFGVTRNPWNLARTPGGSSGGAAAAVASGQAPLALGTDGGGSIRIPAACCGIVGLKPTLGRVPHVHQADLFSTTSYIGPMTKTVAEAAACLDAIVGVDAGDPSLAPGAARRSARHRRARPSHRVAPACRQPPRRRRGARGMRGRGAPPGARGRARRHGGGELRGPRGRLPRRVAGRPRRASGRTWRRSATRWRGACASRWSAAHGGPRWTGPMRSASGPPCTAGRRRCFSASTSSCPRRCRDRPSPSTTTPSSRSPSVERSRDRFAARGIRTTGRSICPATLPCRCRAGGRPMDCRIGLQIVGPWYADRRVLALAAHLERERPCARPMPSEAGRSEARERVRRAPAPMIATTGPRPAAY